uniref:Peroxisomal sarcosine oxidase-like n=1 Tax=Phallusia mammillata TaxID=59560 RepID=A0A6F9DN86_9ASCI|nr:peroxisomal sarcosine oxidase-like [Phallusia mammillata]
MSFDVIVCGAGVQGLWTANYLLQQGKKVLLLEQFPWPHSRGSSHGDSRITRYTYPTSHHSKMMPEAFKKWAELEKKAKTQLFVNCGLLAIGDQNKVDTVLKILKEGQIPHDCLSALDIKQKFPDLDSGDLIGVLEKTAGVLKAKHCLFALQEAFLKDGGSFQDCEKVLSIQPVHYSLVKVATNKSTYSAKSVVLTCGSWINNLLKPLDITLPIKPTRVESVYWKAKNPKRLQADSGFPATILYGKSHIYSTPIIEYPGLMKVSCHFGVVTDPDRRDALSEKVLQVAESHRETLTNIVETNYPGLHPEPAIVESCIYSKTPDEDFILDRHPVFKNIIIGAGFSGHGFKMSPVIGRILGDLALNRTPPYPMHHFSMSRFRHKSSL